jgi:hypothetical protein
VRTRRWGGKEATGTSKERGTRFPTLCGFEIGKMEGGQVNLIKPVRSSVSSGLQEGLPEAFRQMSGEGQFPLSGQAILSLLKLLLTRVLLASGRTKHP